MNHARYIVTVKNREQADNFLKALQDLENTTIVLTDEIEVLPFDESDEFVVTTMSAEEYRKMIKEQVEKIQADEHINSLSDKPVSQDGINPPNNTIKMGDQNDQNNN